MDMPYFGFKFTVIVHLAYFQIFVAINHPVMNTLVARFFSKFMIICLLLVVEMLALRTCAIFN